MARVDPITVEVISKRLVSYTDETAFALERAAYSPMIRDVRDYCAALVDLKGRVIAYNSGGLPTHFNDVGEHVLDGLTIYGADGFEPGDAVMMNDAYICGQHANNVLIYTPIFHKERLVAFASTRGHWQDIGGITANRPVYGTTDAVQEGLQVRSVKLYRGGKPDETVMRLISRNLRQPDVSLGDMRAQVGACRVAERRFGELLEEYDLETILSAVEEVWNQSERLARAEVEKIPDGVYEAESFLDDDGYTPGTHVPIKVKVTVRGSDMTMDFSEIADQVRGPLNSNGGFPAYIAFKAITTPRRPPDEGCFRNLKLVVPPGKIISAKPPAAFGSWSWPFPTIMDTIFKALAPAIPDRVAAGNCGMAYGAGFFHGTNPETNRPFVSLSLLPVGWGGRPTEDGVTSGGMILGYVRDTPVEVTETLYPLLVESARLKQDSGGPGRFRGGLGVEYVIQIQTDTYTNVELGRTQCPPWGLFGGLTGGVGANVFHHPDGTSRPVGNGAINLLTHAGMRLGVSTGGGGGYGHPFDRPAEQVRTDVLDGYVSLEQAREAYGVVLHPEDLEIDAEATRRLRSRRPAR